HLTIRRLDPHGGAEKILEVSQAQRLVRLVWQRELVGLVRPSRCGVWEDDLEGILTGKLHGDRIRGHGGHGDRRRVVVTADGGWNWRSLCNRGRGGGPAPSAPTQPKTN